MGLGIAVIRPAGREKSDLLEAKLEQIRSRGHSVQVLNHPAEPNWSYHSGTIKDRFRTFWAALSDPSVDVLWSSRGGYGASDLLDLLDWSSLRHTKPKTLVGFSDICSLHSGFLKMLGWKGLHAPMPGTDLWIGVAQDDIGQTLDFLEGRTKTIEHQLVTASPNEISGVLFGGCLTVLTALIGTRYFPNTLAGHILFFEDIGENPGRILRNLRQWQQSGALHQVRAMILGKFRDCQLDSPELRQNLANRIQTDFGVQVILSEGFGHVQPNYPLGIGYRAVIRNDRLIWGNLDHENQGRLQQS